VEIDGLISVLGKEGNLIGELILPKMPEITGLFISSRRKDILYVTEKTSNGILKIKLTAFTSELDNKEDFYKV
jgi:sugar lactone lactonase YvrE